MADPVGWGDVAAWAGVCVSFVFSAIALWLSWCAFRAQGRAANEARRSADAAEAALDKATQANEQATRSADASERSAVAAEHVAEIEAARDLRLTVNWVVERTAKDHIRLRNMGAEMATGVTIKHDGDVLIRAAQRGAENLRPGGSAEFYFSVPWGLLEPHEIEVTWNESAEPGFADVPAWHGPPPPSLLEQTRPR